LAGVSPFFGALATLAGYDILGQVRNAPKTFVYTFAAAKAFSRDEATTRKTNKELLAI
jgi:hypothetical protein